MGILAGCIVNWSMNQSGLWLRSNRPRARGERSGGGESTRTISMLTPASSQRNTYLIPQYFTVFILRYPCKAWLLKNKIGCISKQFYCVFYITNRTRGSATQGVSYGTDQSCLSIGKHRTAYAVRLVGLALCINTHLEAS